MREGAVDAQEGWCLGEGRWGKGKGEVGMRGEKAEAKSESGASLGSFRVFSCHGVNERKIRVSWRGLPDTLRRESY